MENVFFRGLDRLGTRLAIAVILGGIAPKLITVISLSDTKPLVREVTANRSNDGSITITGVTEFPAGTKLMIDLLARGGRLAGQSTCRVANGGRFVTEGFSNAGRPWPAGSYTVHIVAYFTKMWQTDQVLASVGVNGAHLPTDALVPDDPEFPKAGRHLEVRIAVSFPEVSGETAAIEAVQRSKLVVTGEGKSSGSVKETVDLFARAPGFRPLDWTAVRDARGSWIVSLTCIDGGQRKQAQWSFSPTSRNVKYLDPLAKLLSYLPPE